MWLFIQVDPFDEFDAMIADRHGASTSTTPPEDATGNPFATSGGDDAMAALDAMLAGVPASAPAPAVVPHAAAAPTSSTAGSYTLLVDASPVGIAGKEKCTLTANNVEELMAGLRMRLKLAEGTAFVVQVYDEDFDEHVNLKELSQLAAGKVSSEDFLKAQLKKRIPPHISVFFCCKICCFLAALTG